MAKGTATEEERYDTLVREAKRLRLSEDDRNGLNMVLEAAAQLANAPLTKGRSYAIDLLAKAIEPLRKSVNHGEEFAARFPQSVRGLFDSMVALHDDLALYGEDFDLTLALDRTIIDFPALIDELGDSEPTEAFFGKLFAVTTKRGTTRRGIPKTTLDDVVALARWVKSLGNGEPTVLMNVGSNASASPRQVTATLMDNGNVLEDTEGDNAGKQYETIRDWWRAYYDAGGNPFLVVNVVVPPNTQIKSGTMGIGHAIAQARQAGILGSTSVPTPTPPANDVEREQLGDLSTEAPTSEPDGLESYNEPEPAEAPGAELPDPEPAEALTAKPRGRPKKSTVIGGTRA